MRNVENNRMENAISIRVKNTCRRLRCAGRSANCERSMAAAEIKFLALQCDYRVNSIENKYYYTIEFATRQYR